MAAGMLHRVACTTHTGHRGGLFLCRFDRAIPLPNTSQIDSINYLLNQAFIYPPRLADHHAFPRSSSRSTCVRPPGSGEATAGSSGEGPRTRWVCRRTLAVRSETCKQQAVGVRHSLSNAIMAIFLLCTARLPGAGHALRRLAPVHMRAAAVSPAAPAADSDISKLPHWQQALLEAGEQAGVVFSAYEPGFLAIWVLSTACTVAKS
jgi:hypothetical protein